MTSKGDSWLVVSSRSAATWAVAWAACVFAQPSSAWAFPEMARHGYPRCSSCHMSPSGGGALSEYGRQISGELLSTWSKEGEGTILAGFVNTPAWLHFGADARAVQIHRDTPQVRADRFLFMQADLEAGATWNSWTASLSAGVYMDQVQSRRHWLQYRLSDDTSLRLGKFQAAYGLGIPDHTSVLRRGLDFDEGSETYNLEASTGTENTQLFATAIFGRPDDSDLRRESGGALRATTTLGNHSLVGASLYRGGSSGQSRWVGGPYAILSLTDAIYFMAEWAFQSRAGSAGFLTFHRLNYELHRGVHVFLQTESAKPTFSSATGQKFAWGPGFQFFPRPRVEITGVWNRQKAPSFPNDWTDYATLLLHLYL